MLASIIRWSLNRPRLIAWACLWFLALGLFYVRDMRLDFTPNLTPAENPLATKKPASSGTGFRASLRSKVAAPVRT